MKPSASTPLLASNEAAHERRQLLRRNKSLNNISKSSRHAIRAEIFQTPFLAVAGLGGHLRNMSRVFSQRFLHQSGDLSPIEESPMTSEALKRGEFPWPELDERFTFWLAFSVFIASLSAFQVGYNTGVINVPQAVIKATLDPTGPVSDMEWSAIVSVFCVGGLLGSNFAGGLADSMGRKTFLLFNNAFFIAGGLLESLGHSVIQMCAGRLLIGWGCGGVTVVVPLYLGELAPAVLRGTVGTLYQLLVVIGIFLANLLGKPLGTESTWRYLLGMVLAPAFIQLVCAPLLPESPLWLIRNGRKKQAAEALCLLRNRAALNIEDDPVGESGVVRPQSNRKSPSFLSLLRQRRYQFPLAIGLGLHFAQQFSGINAVFYYSQSFFERAHVSDAWLGSVLAAFINAVAVVAAVSLMDTAGRRRLLFLSSIGMFFSTLLLTVALFLTSQHQDSIILGYLSVGCVLLFVIFFEIGLGPIPWLLIAEIFPSEVSATAMTATCALNWICNFIVGLTFPSINNALGNYTFVPFGIVCLATCILTHAYLPETKGKSIEEIQEELFPEDEAEADGADEYANYGSNFVVTVDSPHLH